VIDLIQKSKVGVVVNLLAIPMAERPEFLAGLLPGLLAAQARIGRPRLIGIDEAHHVLPRDWDPGANILPADLKDFAFITTRPYLLSPRIGACVVRLLVVGERAEQAVAMFRRDGGETVETAVFAPRAGEVLVVDAAQPGMRSLRIIEGRWEM